MIMAASQRARNSELKQSETWKRHIIRQLKYRNRTQTSVFQDLIESYHSLLEKSKQRALITKGILGSGSRPSLSEDSLTSLKTTTGELAYQVVELQQRIQLKEVTLDEQHTKLYEVQNHLSVLASEHSVLQERVVEVQTRNRLLKQEYDSLLEQHQNMERTYRQEKLRSSEILENMIGPKQQAAVRMNHRNEKRVRAREASLHKELQMAASKNVNIEESGNVSPPKPSSPKRDSSQRLERSHGPLFRSASATSPRIISSIRGLFERKMRGKSVCRSEEDLYIPLGVCLVARVPTKAIFTVDAHELGINAVRFSTSSNLLATGGTDRVIKLWGIEAGTLQNRGTLDGSNEGITSIEFDPTGTQILAASYDKSALFWRLEDSVPKVTLTGHSRKVTAARFKYSQRQVVTGSADRTVKIWDLQRAACIQTIEVLSFCSDVVCSEYLIISSHYDRKIRFWDSRAGTCTQEVPLQGRVTSLDLCPNHRQLLSCSRDDILQLVDLRKSNDRVAFRAEGFKCGSDSTKAIFSPDGSFLAAGSADGAVYIWNVSTGNLEKRLPDMHRASISAVAWSLSGEYVVSVDKSRRAVLWSDI
ncbi:ATG16 autophagy related 16-like 2 isoform X1 [Sinocyclocheilus rhinocerous]|uniref:ATG16 autophagy related 16-like 2 isoform X1 n=1 Tax=Sinocyclocheilus rhinocerous TaxID=307959 RepID=UPI0007B9E374|nr:PREDICTED: autophagy-related protein 16-2-like isoform X1 [Sinocyclocheilus rhinocerous]